MLPTKMLSSDTISICTKSLELVAGLCTSNVASSLTRRDRRPMSSGPTTHAICLKHGFAPLIKGFMEENQSSVFN